MENEGTFLAFAPCCTFNPHLAKDSSVVVVVTITPESLDDMIGEQMVDVEIS